MRVLFWLLLTVVVAGLVHLTALGCCTDEALSLGLVMGALFLGSWFAQSARAWRHRRGGLKGRETRSGTYTSR